MIERNGLYYSNDLKTLKEIDQIFVPKKISMVEECECIAKTANFKNQDIKDFTFSKKIKEIPSFFLDWQDKLANVIMPLDCEIIGEESFGRTKSLKNISLPNSLKTIGREAFRNSGLVDIKLPDNLTSLGPGAFFCCEKLKNIDFGNGIKTISSCCFASCCGLEQIEIPEGIEVIENGAFKNCKNLKKVTLPNSLVFLSPGAFEDCAYDIEFIIPKRLSIKFEDCFINKKVSIINDIDGLIKSGKSFNDINKMLGEIDVQR